MPKPLHEFLVQHRDDVVECFKREVRRRSIFPTSTSDSIVIDHLAEFLDDLAVRLRRGDEGPAAQRSRAHAFVRWQDKYDLRTSISEYGILHTCILRTVRTVSGPPTLEDIGLLNDAISSACAVVAGEYMKYRDEEHARQVRKLEEEAAVRERFMDILGHDLRNPLNSIVMGAAVLLKQELTEGQASVVRRIARGADRMSRMIADLLDFARARAGRMGIERRPGELDDVAKHAIEELRLACPGRTILYSADGRGAGAWDADHLAQVLSNIVGNALTYSPKDSPVDVTLHEGDDTVTIAIHNTGTPIPEEELPTLFDPFRRGRAREDRTGLGLGLYIANEIVRAHGGRIRVASNAQEGTTFFVDLPRPA